MNPWQAARWVVRGVPGVYGAARAAGLSRRDALRVVDVSGRALVIAKRRHPRQWRAENAVRHFVWQAWLTAEYGREVAASVGRAHEGVATDPADSRVDRENNRIGQEYGEGHRDAILGHGLRTALSALADEAGRLWDGGQLREEPRANGMTGSGGGT